MRQTVCRFLRGLVTLGFLVSLEMGRAAFGAPPAEIVLREALVIPPVGRYGRSPAHQDAIESRIVAGQWTMPKAGDKVTLPDGKTQTWTAATADKDGWISSEALRGGYAAITVPSETRRVMLLEAAGHGLVYVNGELRVGDPYETGMTRLPVLLKPGSNEFLFQCGRGRVRARLVAPQSAGMISTADTTLPDFIVGETGPVWGAVVVLNASAAPLDNLYLQAARPNASPTLTPAPTLLPLSMRKIGFVLGGPSPGAAGAVKVSLQLLRKRNGKMLPLDTVGLDLRVRMPNESQKRTFVSEIDGSVQYYAINPARPLSQNAPPPALFLTLHGAGVEAIGQADAYNYKTWGHLVAPTNRRPFGFDWEDWGRLDAMEVLELAQKRLQTDPTRTYLTGHSMGGHGTWQIGATFPDRFAAIGPSAGWISFWSYAGSKRPENPNPVQELMLRASAPSDTLSLEHNYAHYGVYILHGSVDDNVPVEQARTMSQRLNAFHHDWVYFEQPGASHWWDASDEPGADCVDWQPMFDFFARHALPTNENVRQIDFTTASPGVSAWSHWVGIEAQVQPLKPSSVHLRYDPGARRFVGTTENVARIAFDLGHLRPANPVNVELDGQKLPPVRWPASGRRLWLKREGKTWTPTTEPLPLLKRPQRYGPFKQAFRHRMLFVYGTKGTPEENAWAFAKARYDAETFWYRGNGSIDVVADTAFDPTKERDRSVILYGNADTNAAWNALLANSPVQARRGAIRVGEKEALGSDLACLFLRPRPGSDKATVGVVTGSGLIGFRLTERLPYFVSGVDYPDCTVIGPEMLTQGSDGIRCAGFFGPDWSVPSGEFAWKP